MRSEKRHHKEWAGLLFIYLFFKILSTAMKVFTPTPAIIYFCQCERGQTPAVGHEETSVNEPIKLIQGQKSSGNMKAKLCVNDKK